MENHNAHNSITNSINDNAIPHPELLSELKKLRYELSLLKKVPPYMIFTNKTLNIFCTLLPRNEVQMRSVFGVGEHKFSLYGKQVLELIEKWAPVISATN